MALSELLDEFEEPLAYDCIALGLRLRHLGTEEFTWGDLLTIVRQSPRFSAFYRARHPDEVVWENLNTQMLAEIADGVNINNWIHSSGKKKDFPTAYPRPGVEPENKNYGSEPIPTDEMEKWLGW